MTFDEILDQVITLLKRQGRVSYPALKIRFSLDEEYLEALKAEGLRIVMLTGDNRVTATGIARPVTAPSTTSHTGSASRTSVAAASHRRTTRRALTWALQTSAPLPVLSR